MNITQIETNAVAQTEATIAKSESTPMNVPLRNIIVRSNPRTYFDQSEMAELAESIRAQGILQPVLLRKIDDELVLVAGGRRYRAAVAVYGLNGEIPALVKVMTDQEAEAAALIENTHRADMSPTEESDQAAKVTALLDGNRDEAARHLGWSRAKLDKRMALQHCTDAVKVALNERKIHVGHAELLAVAPTALQGKVLEQVIGQNVTVEALRTMLTAKGKPLASACFDKADCQNCHHNSDRQLTLLDTNVGAGFCTNWTCFDGKTTSHVEAVATELKEEVPNVRIIEAGDVRKVIPIRATGQGAVGQEQAENCKGCANYGATVSKIPGEEGKIERSRCFDPVCNTTMQAAYIKSLQEAKAAATTPQAATQAPTAAKAITGKPAATGTAKTPAKKPAATGAVTTRVDDYRYDAWRTIIRKTLRHNPALAQSVFYAMLLKGDANHVGHRLIEQNWAALFGEDAVAPQSLAEMLRFMADQEQDKRALVGAALAATVITGTMRPNIPVILDFLGIDMAATWVLNEKYLKLLTKSELDQLAGEIGLKAFMGDKFGKMMDKKRDEIIAAFLKVEGFDYKGKIPTAMQYKSVLKKS